MKQIVLLITVLPVLCLFQNCSKIQPGVAVEKASDSGDPNTNGLGNTGGNYGGIDVPIVDHFPYGDDSGWVTVPDDTWQNQPPNSSDDYTTALAGSCASLAEDIPAGTDNYKLTNLSGEFDVMAANIVYAENISGSLRIGKANELTAYNLSGRIVARAVKVPLLNNTSGFSCIVSTEVGTISNVSGSLKIVATSIDKITNKSGPMHIYGAVVKEVSNASGGICLHDGARVLHATNVSGNIGECQ